MFSSFINASSGRRAIALAISTCVLTDCSLNVASATAVPRGASGERTTALRARPDLQKALHIVYAFSQSPDGQWPGPISIDAAGDIFGTTMKGGAANDGIAFELQPTPSGNGFTETVIHSFSGTDGESPAGLALDGNANVFVTSTEGGASGADDGTLVELTPANGVYQEATLFSFNGLDGATPGAPPTATAGMTYATVQYGGKYGVGAIVGVDGVNESDLYDFTGHSDGLGPASGLAIDASGALYGTTASGGSQGLGTVYKFVPSAHGGRFKTIWTFRPTGTGINPASGVVVDAAGNIYGTTLFTATDRQGYGVIYKLSPTGKGYAETILHTFTGSPDGQYPEASLALSGTTLYGTTSFGGAGRGRMAGWGTVFEISTAGSNYEILHSFKEFPGGIPSSPVAAFGNELFGTIEGGGPYEGGFVYRLDLR